MKKRGLPAVKDDRVYRYGDYRTWPDDEVPNVVQPDLTIICDPSKLRAFGCVGAPDWVIEILSPSTSRRDLAEKHALYERHGVKEYWVIDPGNRYVHVYLWGGDGKYQKPRLHVGAATVKSAVCTGFEIKPEELFAAIPA